ncbi:MAG: 4Fe-4S binding protein [Treponema sp.]|nr:4Fe-4S binding protein [Treponema sp.]
MAKKGKVRIDRELCKGCYWCINACPVKVLEKDANPNSTGTYPAKPADSEVSSSQGKCIACGNCYEVCPDVCIEVSELSA